MPYNGADGEQRLRQAVHDRVQHLAVIQRDLDGAGETDQQRGAEVGLARPSWEPDRIRPLLMGSARPGHRLCNEIDRLGELPRSEREP